MGIQYWLMKSEPDVFSIDALAQQHIAPWDGIRNYQVRNMLRDQMQMGDLAFFYHSSCAVPAIVGVLEIVSAAYPDSSAWQPESPYFDPKSDPAQPRWYGVDVRFVHKLEQPLTLAQLRNYQTTELSQLALLRKGNRLSIVPVSTQEWAFIHALIEA